MFVMIAVAVAAVVLVAMGIQVYNALVSLKFQVDRAWANIDVILKQRFDEIPQLIQVIEQYVQYERGTIDRLVEARRNYGSAQSVNEKVQASQEMSFALKGVIAIGENYPELRSNQNFVQLQSRVSELENMIADRREHFNEAVTNFNTRLQQIPDVFFAGLLAYKPYTLYEVPKSETATPSLKMKIPS